MRCEVFDATKTYCTATETVEARLGAASASAAAAVLGLATEHTARGGEQCRDLGSAEADPLAEVRIAEIRGLGLLPAITYQPHYRRGQKDLLNLI